ncbi:hypothetical protein [Candidatus Neomicrothrix sp.]|jgi:hypothetical protein|uniref:hypothetical protein n=1 Tax=Candidatus Neomicrothrix sp. TaxID=2719034 RepID=UPI001B461AD7|nr:hypothetical protein [Candidatus Microthrix sp.]MBP7851306.1 hypothetical protein [Candidatus Microthrix sp.]MBP7876658.1 hypothetical protein [Candidatus Microthrix sp.]MBP9619372.1 hypothetical protein [Candidatus Microthrix sp.]
MTTTQSAVDAGAAPKRAGAVANVALSDVTKATMASATADLQRDLGGAIMQSLMGVLPTAGYASAAKESFVQGQDRADGIAAGHPDG